MKKTDPRTAAIASISRRECGLSLTEAARLISRSKELLSNFEGGAQRMAEANTIVLLQAYLERLGGREAVPADDGRDGIDTLVERLAVVLLVRRAARIRELVGALESGAQTEVVDFIIQEELRQLHKRVADRLRAAIYDQRYYEKRVRERVLAELGAPPVSQQAEKAGGG